jgi:hypothetical protein
LALALLVAAHHQRSRGRIELESDERPDILVEPLIVRQLERSRPCGFKSIFDQMRCTLLGATPA